VSRVHEVRIGKRSAMKSARSKDLVVFSILRETRCKECNKELWKGNFLFIEADRPLCLSCADLDQLIYLPSGDAALTRRARKYSPLSAVVVRFSRSRGRYERQGILISETALEQAEEESLADSERRALRRERDAVQRANMIATSS
jgi:phage FluMu protein Com